MYRNPYQTTTGKNYLLDKIITQLEESYIRSELLYISTENGNIYIVTGQNENVPSFTHMINVELIGSEKTISVIDGRQFTRNKSNDSGFTITSSVDFNMAVLRAKLELSSDVDFTDLYTAGDLPLWVYTQWVSETISGRLGLDPESQLNVAILAAALYVSNHTVEQEWEDTVLARIITKVARVTNIPAARVLETLDGVKYIKNIREFIEYCYLHVDNSRIKTLNVGLVIQLLTSGSGWRGANAQEIIAASLEHAPTWHAVMYAAVDDRSYSKSRLTNYIKRFRANDGNKDYLRNLKTIIG